MNHINYSKYRLSHLYIGHFTIDGNSHYSCVTFQVSHEMRNYESEFGTKQSCSYEVRHFYKKLFFNPGIYFKQNPFPQYNGEGIKKTDAFPKDFEKIQITSERKEHKSTKGFNQVKDMFV